MSPITNFKYNEAFWCKGLQLNSLRLNSLALTPRDTDQRYKPSCNDLLSLG